MDVPSSSFKLAQETFRVIPLQEALKRADFKHAAHCFIYSRNSSMVMNKYLLKAKILMQLRFDGTFGFPGGGIDKENNIVVGLNRELKEEINLDDSKFGVSESDYILSYLNESQNLCLHLYQLELSEEELKSLERRVIDAEEYGNETLGMVCVPLYVMEDGFRGFPAFLCNNFVSVAREQLLYALSYLKILSSDEIKCAVDRWKILMKKKCENFNSKLQD